MRGVTDLATGRARYFRVLPRERKAAFLAGGEVVGEGHDLGVDQRDRSGLVVRHQVDGDQPQELADLRRGETNAGRQIHRREHLRGQIADRSVVGFADRFGLGFQDRVRRDQNRNRDGSGGWHRSHVDSAPRRINARRAVRKRNDAPVLRF